MSDSNTADALEKHDERLRDLEVGLATLNVTVAGLGPKLDKLGDALDKNTTALDSRLAPLEKGLTALTNDVDIAKKVGGGVVAKFWPVLLAGALGMGAGGPLIKMLEAMAGAH